MFLPRLLWCGVLIPRGVGLRWLRLWRLLPISPLLCVELLGMIGMGRGFWMFWRPCGLRSHRLWVGLRGVCLRRRGGLVGDGGGRLGLALGVPWSSVG